MNIAPGIPTSQIQDQETYTDTSLYQQLHSVREAQCIPIYERDYILSTPDVPYSGIDLAHYQGPIASQVITPLWGYQAPNIPFTGLSYGSEILKAATNQPQTSATGMQGRSFRSPGINEGY